MVIPTPSNSDTNASIKAESYTHAKVAPHGDSKGKQETVLQTRELAEINALHIKWMKLLEGSKQGLKGPVFFLPNLGSDAVHVVCYETCFKFPAATVQVLI